MMGVSANDAAISTGFFAANDFAAERRRPGASGRAAAQSTQLAAQSIERFEREIAFRELLLEEIVHRTKNTLQLAVAILGEQADSANDPWIRHVMRGVQKQILTLCQTHDHFNRSAEPGRRSLGFRVAAISSSIRDSFGKRADQIELGFNVAEILLERHQEVCLSLILQELLTNAFKHAFPCGRQGAIMVELGIDDLAVCHLAVRDDGIGRTFRSPASVGLVLVEAFASGLQGEVAITSDKGTTVEVSFPLSQSSVVGNVAI